MDIHEKKIKLDNSELVQLLGYNEDYLKMIDNRFNAVVTLRGNNLILKGGHSEIKLIENIFKELAYMLKRNGELSPEDVSSVIEILLTERKNSKKVTNGKGTIIFWGLKDSVKARTPRQLDYYRKVKKSDLVFAVGPAGTGKTFLAVAMALEALKANQVDNTLSF